MEVGVVHRHEVAHALVDAFIGVGGHVEGPRLGRVLVLGAEPAAHVVVAHRLHAEFAPALLEDEPAEPFLAGLGDAGDGGGAVRIVEVDLRIGRLDAVEAAALAHLVEVEDGLCDVAVGLLVAGLGIVEVDLGETEGGIDIAGRAREVGTGGEGGVGLVPAAAGVADPVEGGGLELRHGNRRGSALVARPAAFDLVARPVEAVRDDAGIEAGVAVDGAGVGLEGRCPVGVDGLGVVALPVGGGAGVAGVVAGSRVHDGLGEVVEAAALLITEDRIAARGLLVHGVGVHHLEGRRIGLEHVVGGGDVGIAEIGDGAVHEGARGADPGGETAVVVADAEVPPAPDGLAVPALEEDVLVSGGGFLEVVGTGGRGGQGILVHVDDILGGLGGFFPFLGVVGGEDLLAVAVDLGLEDAGELVVLPVVERGGGIGQDAALEGPGGALGGAAGPGVVGLDLREVVRQVLDGLVELGDHEIDVLVHGVAVQLGAFGILRCELVAPDDDGTVLAEEAEVVESPQETRLGLHRGLDFGRVLGVEVDVVHEDGALADGDIVGLPLVVLDDVAGSGGAVVAAAELVEGTVAEEAEEAFVGAGDDVPVAVMRILVVREIRIEVRQVLFGRVLLGENLLEIGLVLEIDVEVGIAGCGHQKGCYDDNVLFHTGIRN